MSRAMYIEDVDFYRSFLVSPDKETSSGPYGPYCRPGDAKSVATRHRRWGYKDFSTVIQKLTACVDGDGKPYLAWEDVDE